MSERDGGPAFPQIETDAAFTREGIGDSGDTYGHVYSYGGMSLRDYFAAKALPQAIAHELSIRSATVRPDEFRYDQVAKAAYVMADAMLKARER